MAMAMSSLLNGKDSRWLQLEVCREFQRNKCTRPDTECKFAHPPANVEVQNGRVTACYDSIKGRCNREKPPCKYFHPPQHLKDQLLINGRNHLALKNALMQQIQQGLTPGQPLVPGQVPTVLLDTLPVCQDFNRQVCNRPACKFIHLSDGNVEVIENRVTVCRDAVKGACMRPQCKYYHIPVALPPAPLMAIASSASP
ncbi:protein muscleblind isoform X13 [Linepithema humile]|uniref:protein muscleblind isoform X13 n=1 Tax=Linepithema humile TaxID=83485 RepID=UPI00351E5A78